tara:strand:- start:2010 stop:2705 length:696 start_codon:yes stop_codon:yes gene_type:complete
MLYNGYVTRFFDGAPSAREDKVIFLHIPKTGGTSIEHCLSKQISKGSGRHYNIKETEDIIGAQDINEYTIFTVIRNPLDRIISTWRWWAFHKDGYITKPHLNHKIIPCTSFRDYVFIIKDYFDGNTDVKDGGIFADSKAPLWVSHVERLNWWLTKKDGSLVKCDFLRFEDLNRQWAKFRKKLDLKGKLDHKNGSQTIPFTKSRDKLYDEETYKIVSEIYKDEMRQFNYEKG